MPWYRIPTVTTTAAAFRIAHLQRARLSTFGTIAPVYRGLSRKQRILNGRVSTRVLLPTSVRTANQLGRRNFSPFDPHGPAYRSPIDNYLGRGVADALGVGFFVVMGGWLVAIALHQRIFLPGPTETTLLDPRSSGGDPEMISIPGPSGTQKSKTTASTCAAAFYRPPAEDAPVLVYFHDGSDQLGGRPAVLANHFRDMHGFGFYAVEYPDYGYADGKKSESCLYATAEALLLHLASELGVSKDRMVLFGQSVGCCAALEMAKLGYGRRMVLVSPFSTGSEFAAIRYPVLSVWFKLPLMDEYDNKSKISNVHVPVLIIHGTGDKDVPISMADALASKATNAQLMAVPDMNHTDAFERPDVMLAIADFVQLMAVPDLNHTDALERPEMML